MKNARGSVILDEMLEPVSRSLNLEAARALVTLGVDERTQARVDVLAEKCNAGRITSDEHAEYEAYVQASTLIGILRSKARRFLAQAGVH